MAAKYPCLRCSKNVPNSCKGVPCHTCKNWVHVDCEPSITEEMYKWFKAMEDKGMAIGWYCQACKEVSSKFESMFKDLKHSITEVATKQQATDEKVERLEVQQESSDNKQKKMDDRLKNLESTAADSDVHVMAALDEIRDIQQRENNLIFHAVKESTCKTKEERIEDDIDAIVGIQNKIGVKVAKDDIAYTTRLGIFNKNKNRPLKVVFKDKRIAPDTLKNARHLNKLQEPFKSINITRDVTRLQRKKDEQVRTEVERLNSELTSDEAKNVKWRSVGRKGEKRPRKILLTEEEKQMMIEKEKNTENGQETVATVDEEMIVEDDQEGPPTSKRARLKRKTPNPYS